MNIYCSANKAITFWWLPGVRSAIWVARVSRLFGLDHWLCAPAGGLGPQESVRTAPTDRAWGQL